MRTDPSFRPLLVERARRLARPIAAESLASASDGGLLRFSVGSEALAIATEAIVEVQAAPKPAPLPGLPAWLAGLVGIHGRILPAVWLDRFLAGGPGPGADGSATQAIVVQVNDGTIALFVTAVDGITPAAGSELDPLPAGMSPAAVECALGFHRGHVVIDAARLVHAVSAALGSSTGGVRQPSLLELEQGAQSHAPPP